MKYAILFCALSLGSAFAAQAEDAQIDGNEAVVSEAQPQPAHSAVVHCRSSNYSYHECNVQGFINDVKVQKQTSHSACDEGYSWGFSNHQIWVNHGCEADFQVFLQ